MCWLTAQIVEVVTCASFIAVRTYHPHQFITRHSLVIACSNFIVLTKQEILLISFTDFFDAASRRHNDIILLPAIRRVSGKDFVFQQDSAAAHRAEHVQQLNCCVRKRQTFLRPTCGLQTAQISVLWITRSALSCSIVSTTNKSGYEKNNTKIFATDFSLIVVYLEGCVKKSRFLTNMLLYLETIQEMPIVIPRR